ncbi:MAG: outer membrane beta-barrel protein [Aliishimia sp.]
MKTTLDKFVSKTRQTSGPFVKASQGKTRVSILGMLAACTTFSAPAFAGSAEPAVIETAPVAVAPQEPVTTFGGDWTGGYVGLGLGSLDIDGSGTAGGDDITYGLHGGYDYDFGRFVVGGELEFDGTDIDLGGAATADSVTRLKLRGGYDLGRTLIYATAGAAEVDTSLGSDTGAFGGIGAAYQINDRFYVGGEVLRHRFEDIGGSGVNADATSISLRGGLRF